MYNPMFQSSGQQTTQLICIQDVPGSNPDLKSDIIAVSSTQTTLHGILVSERLPEMKLQSQLLGKCRSFTFL
jgi:hypothetical protein